MNRVRCGGRVRGSCGRLGGILVLKKPSLNRSEIDMHSLEKLVPYDSCRRQSYSRLRLKIDLKMFKDPSEPHAIGKDKVDPSRGGVGHVA